jgi:hypothetical protein
MSKNGSKLDDTRLQEQHWTEERSIPPKARWTQHWQALGSAAGRVMPLG